MKDASDFFLYVITAPEPVAGEADIINRLLRSGAVRWVGIRRPGASDAEVAALVESVDPNLRSRLRMHDRHLLGLSLGVKAVHLNRRCPEAPVGATSISASCHSVGEIPARLEFVTLSPVFDSISKPGYLARSSFLEDGVSCAPSPVVALGGVTPSHFDTLRRAGFAGAALLGYVWADPLHTAAHAEALIEYINKNRYRNVTVHHK